MNKRINRYAGYATSSYHAFTLIELLVVIGIISVLSSMLLPAVQTAKSKARYTRWQAFQANQRADSSLVGSWTFEEGSGATLTNHAQGLEIENYRKDDLNGTLTNNPVWTVGRWPRKTALAFSNSGTYVDCGTNPATNTSSALSLWAWILPTQPLGYGVVASKGNGYVSDGYCIYWYNSGSDVYIYSFMRNNSTGESIFGFNTVPTVSAVWRHIGFTWDNVSTTVTTYVDGQALPNTHTFTGMLPEIQEGFIIGSSLSWPTYYRGLIDEVAVFERALSASEMEMYFKMGRP